MEPLSTARPARAEPRGRSRPAPSPAALARPDWRGAVPITPRGGARAAALGAEWARGSGLCPGRFCPGGAFPRGFPASCRTLLPPAASSRGLLHAGEEEEEEEVGAARRPSPAPGKSEPTRRRVAPAASPRRAEPALSSARRAASGPLLIVLPLPSF